jgi:hypothetical protein
MSRVARMLDGWQAGLAVVVTSLLVVLVVVPRPRLPEEIPIPRPSVTRLADLAEEDAALASQVENEELPFEVRQVGESFRQYGLAAAMGDGATANLMRSNLGAQLRAVPAEMLLRLRAYQTRDFLRELSAFETSGVESRGLQELGGEFVRTARAAGWVQPRGSGVRLLADDATRRVLFRKRWGEVLQLQDEPFGLTLDEERAFHAFLFRHPVVHVPDADRTDRQRRCQSANEYLLRKVTAFGAMDRTYPTDYVQGLLLLRLDRPGVAVEPLVRFVESNPDGPYTLHARNALRYAQDRTHRLLTQ